MTELERLEQDADEIQARIRAIRMDEASKKYSGWIGKFFKTSNHGSYTRVVAIETGLKCHGFIYNDNYARVEIGAGGLYGFDEDEWVEVSEKEYFDVFERMMCFLREQIRAVSP